MLRPQRNRYPSIGPAPVLALRTIGEFGRIDVGDAHPLAPAADRVAVVDRWRQTQGGGGEDEGHKADLSRSVPQRNAPTLPATTSGPDRHPQGRHPMPASLGGRRCVSTDARLSE